MVRTRQFKTHVKQCSGGTTSALYKFMHHDRFKPWWCRLEATYGRWRVGGAGGRAYHGITRMFANRVWPDFRPPVVKAATRALRGAGGKRVGDAVAKGVRSVLCARSKAAADTARARAAPAVRAVLDVLDQEGIAATHMELPLFDIFSGHATGVDIVGIDRRTRCLVLVELKVHNCTVEQLSTPRDGQHMKKPLHIMDDTLMNHATCQLLWAMSTLRTQYGNPPCRGLVVVVPPSGAQPAVTHHIRTHDKRLAYWEEHVRPELAAHSATETKQERTKEAARKRRVRKRRERQLHGPGARKKARRGAVGPVVV